MALEPAPGFRPIEADPDLAMGAIGDRGVLVEPPPEGGLEVVATSDALLVQTSSAEVQGSLAASEAVVTRLRLGLEGTWRGIETGSGMFLPTVEIGMRHDDGDAETGSGTDMGTRLDWTDRTMGIGASLAARSLLAHSEEEVCERGFADSLSWDPDPYTHRGPRLTPRQAVGAQATGGTEAPLRPDTVRVLDAANDDGPGRRTQEARFGYGFAVFGGRYTSVPEIGFGLTETGRETILGGRLLEARRAGLVFGLDMAGRRRESVVDDTEPEHRFGLGLGWAPARAPREDLELRIDALRLLPANYNPENRIGVTVTARWQAGMRLAWSRGAVDWNGRGAGRLIGAASRAFSPYG